MLRQVVGSGLSHTFYLSHGVGYDDDAGGDEHYADETDRVDGFMEDKI